MHKPTPYLDGRNGLQSLNAVVGDPVFANPLDLKFDNIVNPTLVLSLKTYMAQETLSSCVSYFRSYIWTFVQHGRTPFTNPSIYDDVMPACLQDAYCTCAAYLSKSATNASVISNILSSKCDELIARRPCCSPKAELASVQALIMYQIIRLFDGDMYQRAIAETQFQVLKVWVADMRHRCAFELPYEIQQSPYRRWLFVESVQRTVIVSAMIQGVYFAIKNGFCDQVAEMASLPLTVRGDLWNAASEGDWMYATRGNQPGVLPYHEFVEAWDGDPVEGYTEEFQKMLLVACLGRKGLQAKFLQSLTGHTE